MKRNVLLIATLALLSLPPCLSARYAAVGDSAAVAALNGFVDNIDRFNSFFPQEKVYLHFDNTAYFRNETIWFKAYVLRHDRQSPSDMSRVLYVDLVGPGGDVLHSGKLKITDGQADGYIKLDKLLSSGFYEVRAYTRYMLNWGADGHFSRVFPVFDAPAAEGDYSATTIDEPAHRNRLPDLRAGGGESPSGRLNVAFYPEGGHVVAGLPQQMAFGATDRDGLPVEVSGWLEGAGGERQPVSTLRQGRGVFAWTPTAAPHRLVLADSSGTRRTFELPAAEQSGCVLTVNAVAADRVTVRVATRGLPPQPLALLLVHGGAVEACQIFDGGPAASSFAFSRSDMSGGVSQIAVVDAGGNVLAERMVFVAPQAEADSISLEFAGGTLLRPCGRVVMNASTRPNSTFSLAVRDFAGEVNGSRGNAATWLLLASDLKGYVADPDYYFEADDDLHRRAADLLMLVQGWRRYDLREMMTADGKQRIQPLEDGLYLDGTVRLPGKRKSAGGLTLRATLYNRDGAAMNGEQEVDSLGNFAFRLADCEGEWSMFLETSKGGKAVRSIVSLDRWFAPRARRLSPLELLPAEPAAPMAVAAAADFEAERLSLDKRNVLLKEVKVTGKRIFEKAREGWEKETDGKYRASIYYNCDKDRDAFYDKGMPDMSLLGYLSLVNPFFATSGSTSSAATTEVGGEGQPATDTTPVGERGTEAEPDNSGIADLEAPEKLYLVDDELKYKNKPVVWILNNSFYQITGLQHSKTDAEITHIYNATHETMPFDDLEQVKSVYIAERGDVWRRYVEIPEFIGMEMPTIFVYTHHAAPHRKKGLRRTFFSGYDRRATFEMPDYSLLPPMQDHRRTVYWNPSVTTGADGRATVEFYNNSSCREFVVSAEGVAPDGTVLIRR